MKSEELSASKVLAALVVPAASANSFNITNNNLGLSGTLGTVTTTQNGSNVDINVAPRSAPTL